MARETPASRRSEAAAEEPQESRQVLVWNHVHPFEEREISGRDWQLLGSTSTKAVTWTKHNNWTVAREDLPLDDDQLAGLLERDPSLKLQDK